MRAIKLFLFLSIVFLSGCSKDNDPENKPEDNAPVDMIIDHRCTKLSLIPAASITSAKQTLHIAYGHTSHGSQLTDGMTGLVTFKGSAYSWKNIMGSKNQNISCS